MAMPNSMTDDDTMTPYWTRYEHLKYNDVMKNVLIEVSSHSCLQPYAVATTIESVKARREILTCSYVDRRSIEMTQ